MPLNGGGTASKPPGTTAVPNSTISSAPFNSVIDDIYAIFNTPRPIAYGGTNGTDIATAQTNLNVVGYSAQTLTEAQKLQARTNIGAVNATAGDIYGLTLSNNVGDPTNDIDIAVGSAASDGATPFSMPLASILTKRLDAAWAVGTGNGGWLDGASMPNGTGHVFVIQRSDTGVVDVGASASLTPTLPTNYDRKRRIGSIIRASAAILGFSQNGDEFLIKVPTISYSSGILGTTAISQPMTVPLGIVVEAKLNGYMIHAATPSAGVLLSSLDQSDNPSDGTNFTVTAQVVSVASAFIQNVRTNTSGQIRIRGNTASTTISITTYGWVDTRGRI